MIYKFKHQNKNEIIRNHLNMGETNYRGERIDVNSLYIERSGKPCIPVMGEYHFSRASASSWHKELCKMKAGGITVVATYIFWIYHEEEEGKFDFSGDRDVRTFINECANIGLDVVIRIGPWAHGECRNGGFPDWLMKKPYKLRDNNREYMEKVRIWYSKIYEQLNGMFYRDGGNIIAIQFENELVDNAEHLFELKKTALEIGYSAPIYTATGWNSKYGAKIPVDEVMPVFGGYPEAPWEQHTNRLQPSSHYFFNGMRNDSAIGTDVIETTNSDNWQLPYERYPFATCELGGGVQVTHLRRPKISPMDIYALSLVKLGCGNNLIGYYMYHGGTNKIGKLSTLNENKATGYPNDYTVLSYDFQAPLSEYGEARDHYGMLNMLHMFAADFGDITAPMRYCESEHSVMQDDVSSLRCSMRENNGSGFVFVNHYQRLAHLEDIEDVIIDTGSVVFPKISVCGDISFFMPFNMNLSGNILEYALAQPLCKAGDTYFFSAVGDISPEYKFADGEIIKPDAGINSVVSKNNIKIVTLTFDESRFLRKLSGKVYIGCGCNLYEDNGKILSIEDGEYSYFEWTGSDFKKIAAGNEFKNADVDFYDVSKPFEPKYIEELKIGGERQLKWKEVTVSSDKGFVEIPYEYDAAQIYADQVMIADNFYYGAPWRVPAKMLYGKKCFLVMSEMKNDFYREF